MDFKHFKKVGLSKSGKTTVFKHKDGHFLHIAHGGLASEHRKAMEELPCYDEGGPVTPEGIEKGFKQATGFSRGGTVNEPLDPEDKSSGVSKAGAFVRSNIPHTNELAKNEHKRTLQNMQAQPAPKLMAGGGNVRHYADADPSNQPVAPNSPLPSPEEAMEDLGTPQGGSQGASLGTASSNPPDAQDQAAPPMPPSPTSQSTSDTAGTAPTAAPVQSAPIGGAPTGTNPARQWLDNEDSQSAMALAQGKVTPKTYQSLFNKRDTLGQIGTIFGLMVGGAGAGMAHQPNAMMEMMHQQIQNDMEGQQQSATNAQNFLRIAQNDPLIKAQAKKYGLDADQVAQTIALTNQTNATYHDLVTKVQNMPEATPQQVAAKQAKMQGLSAVANFMGPRLSNAKDLAAGYNGTPPETDQSQPQSPGSIQPILHKGSDSMFKGMQFSPIAAKDYNDVKDQYTQAQLADKALQNLGPTFNRLTQDTSGFGSSLVKRGAQLANNLEGLPFGVGKIASGPIHAASELSESSRDYDSAQTSLVSDITNALKGTNVHGDEITRIVKANTPVKGDSPEEVQRKRDTIEGFVKRAVPTTLLKKYGLSTQ